MNNNPPTQHSSATTDKRPADEEQEQDREKKEKKWNYKQNEMALLRDSAKRDKYARYDEEDMLLADCDKPKNANNLIWLTKTDKRLTELRQEMQEAKEQLKQMEKENPDSKTYDVHCYRLRMISEAKKQPLATRRTATIVKCATAPPEAQSYQKTEPANTITRGTTGATVDSTKSILKLKKQINKNKERNEEPQVHPRVEQTPAAPVTEDKEYKEVKRQNYYYRMEMIYEASKQPLATRRIAVIVKFATTLTEEHSYVDELYTIGPRTKDADELYALEKEHAVPRVEQTPTVDPQVTVPTQVKQAVLRVDQKPVLKVHCELSYAATIIRAPSAPIEPRNTRTPNATPRRSDPVPTHAPARTPSAQPRRPAHKPAQAPGARQQAPHKEAANAHVSTKYPAGLSPSQRQVYYDQGYA